MTDAEGDPVRLEIVLMADEYALDTREALADPLDIALRAESLGEVSGGGSGRGTITLDVEVADLEAGLAIIRRVLREHGVAKSTVIEQYAPERETYAVY